MSCVYSFDIWTRASEQNCTMYPTDGNPVWRGRFTIPIPNEILWTEHIGFPFRTGCCSERFQMDSLSYPEFNSQRNRTSCVVCHSFGNLATDLWYNRITTAFPLNRSVKRELNGMLAKVEMVETVSLIFRVHFWFIPLSIPQWRLTHLPASSSRMSKIDHFECLVYFNN